MNKIFFITFITFTSLHSMNDESYCKHIATTLRFKRECATKIYPILIGKFPTFQTKLECKDIPQNNFDQSTYEQCLASRRKK